jgi:hypothetical protein
VCFKSLHEYPAAEADRGRHPGFPRYNVLAGGPGSLALAFGEEEGRMDEARFWSIIGVGGRKALADPERHLAAVHKELLKLSPDEIRGFHRQFNQKLADAYT